jgi:hypothetical protein
VTLERARRRRRCVGTRRQQAGTDRRRGATQWKLVTDLPAEAIIQFDVPPTTGSATGVRYPMLSSSASAIHRIQQRCAHDSIVDERNAAWYA